MKPLKKVGLDDPKGWEEQPEHYPIIPEPQDENELPVPYYDSDDVDECDEETDEEYSGYKSDASSSTTGTIKRITHVNVFNNTWILREYKTCVSVETDFLEE